MKMIRPAAPTLKAELWGFMTIALMLVGGMAVYVAVPFGEIVSIPCGLLAAAVIYAASIWFPAWTIHALALVVAVAILLLFAVSRPDPFMDTLLTGEQASWIDGDAGGLRIPFTVHVGTDGLGSASFDDADSAETLRVDGLHPREGLNAPLRALLTFEDGTEALYDGVSRITILGTLPAPVPVDSGGWR